MHETGTIVRALAVLHVRHKTPSKEACWGNPVCNLNIAGPSLHATYGERHVSEQISGAVKKVAAAVADRNSWGKVGTLSVQCPDYGHLIWVFLASWKAQNPWKHSACETGNPASLTPKVFLTGTIQSIRCQLSFFVRMSVEFKVVAFMMVWRFWRFRRFWRALALPLLVTACHANTGQRGNRDGFDSFGSFGPTLARVRCGGCCGGYVNHHHCQGAINITAITAKAKTSNNE